MKFDRSLFVKTAETQVSEDGTLFVYVDEETLEFTGRVLIKSKTSSGGALFYADGTPQQWIPVTERLPENLKPVNITYINEDPAPYYEHIKGIPFTATAIYYRGGWYWWSCTCVDVLAEYGHSYSDSMDEGIEVKAWMPLPEPFKGGDDK